MTTPGSAVSPSPFEHIERFTLTFPIRSADWTIWPDKPQSWLQFTLGHPLELSPFTRDYLRVSCDGERLAIDPHYDRSTWDTFWVDAQGVVVVHAFRGLFRETLGSQPRLLEGICAVLDVLQSAVQDPRVRHALGQILEHLRGPVMYNIMESAPFPTGLPHLRGLSRRFWRWKLRGGS